MRKAFQNRGLVDKTLSSGQNPLIYEYYESFQPSTAGHLNFGTTILHPGKIGEEFFFTRGHHHLKESGEIYSFFKGNGFFLLQTKNGETAEVPIKSGSTIYVPPGWGHRMVNIGKEKLISLFCYDADAGHDYDSLERTGFAKIVIEKNDKLHIIDNQNYQI